MSVKTTLENLRKATPGCRVAAFVDLHTSMVLASDADSPVPQEDLDALAAGAASLFQTLDPALVPVLTAASQGHGLCQASLTGRDRSLIAVRTDGAAQEAICCELGPSADLPLAFAKAAGASSALSEGDEGAQSEAPA